MSKLALTSISRVLDYMNAGTGLDSPTIDPKLSNVYLAEIDRVSQTILGHLNINTVRKRTVTDYYSGTGSDRILLRQFPVLEVASVVSSFLNVPPVPASGPGAGFMLVPWDGIPAGINQLVVLSGYCFARGTQNVCITYDAGYVTLNETVTIPEAAEYNVAPAMAWGLWADDQGVWFEDGTKLTPVVPPAAPGPGQYAPPTPFETAGPRGFYSFNAADAGKAIRFSYSYIPYAVEGAACQLVAERIKYRDRIGVSSKSLAGQETVNFSQRALPEWVKLELRPFRSVIPIQ